MTPTDILITVIAALIPSIIAFASGRRSGLSEGRSQAMRAITRGAASLSLSHVVRVTEAIDEAVRLTKERDR